MYEYCVASCRSGTRRTSARYHLQEAGATPVQELAFALADAIGVLDACAGARPARRDGVRAGASAASRSSSTPACGSSRRCARCARSPSCGTRSCRERYGVDDPKLRQFRYGVQVNSLGLTEQQPENNAWRILIEALGVTLSRDARCRALQLPTWNEALSLPRPWDQQWSLRLQQILALRDRPARVPGPVRRLAGRASAQGRRADAGAREELGAHRATPAARVARSRPATEVGARAPMARAWPDRERRAGRRRREQVDRGPAVAARRRATTAACSGRPDAGGDPGTAAARRSDDARRASAPSTRSRAAPRRARTGATSWSASIECALAGVTTGEWAGTLRGVFGEYRARDRRRRAAAAARRRPRRGAPRPRRSARATPRATAAHGRRQAGPRRPLQRRRGDRGRRPPLRLRRHLRRHPAAAAADRAAGRGGGRDVVGLSVLSGSHLELTRQCSTSSRRRAPARSRSWSAASCRPTTQPP